VSIIFDSIKTRNLDQVYEINLNEYYFNLVTGQIEGSERVDDDFFVSVLSGLNHPDFNAVVQVDITDNFEEVYTKVADYFHSRGVSYTWYVIPSTEPEGLVDQLKEKGLRYVGDDVVVGVELKSIPRNIDAPNSLYIESITTSDKLNLWVDLYCRSRNISGDIVEKFKSIYQNTDFEDPRLPFRKYIGWLNGEPIACSTLLTSGGIAAVYDETILPRYKNWGIENAINITPLKKAKDMGYLLGLIPTNLGSQKRLTRLGFTHLFNVKKMVHLVNMGRSRRPRRR
jgi:hypothetical protein